MSSSQTLGCLNYVILMVDEGKWRLGCELDCPSQNRHSSVTDDVKRVLDVPLEAFPLSSQLQRPTVNYARVQPLVRSRIRNLCFLHWSLLVSLWWEFVVPFLVYHAEWLMFQCAEV